MSRRLLVGPGLVVSASLGACVLTTDLDGLDDPQASADGGADADAATFDAADAQGADTGSPEAGADASVLFADDFNRANGPVGNGWLDPTGSYRIEDGHLPVTGNGWAFQNNTLYRPKRDDARNIMASIEFTPLSIPPSYPQVHVRVQPGRNYECYAVGVPMTDDTIFVGRCQPGNGFLPLGDQALSENIVAGRTYRLSISATGTSPVHLGMMLERKTDKGYSVIGKKEIDDAAPERVRDPGLFGISGDTNPNWMYDNFSAVKITE